MCLKPLAGIPNGYTAKGKINYKIVSYTEAFGKQIAPDRDQIIPYHPHEIIQIPCGKCIECRKAYAKQWSDRCMLELQDHEFSYFLTLTYEDKYLPLNCHEDCFEDIRLGNLAPGLQRTCSLEKSDFQKFMKRLRRTLYNKTISDPITGERIKNPNFQTHKCRYYMTGEYGSASMRPHYHCILFGLNLKDLKPYKRTSLGDWLYTSEFLQKLWPYGYVVIGDVTPNSCAYVARYCNKKLFNDRSMYDRIGLVPEYTNMSLKPAIGANQYSEEIFEKGYICLSTENGGIKITPPRYFKNRYYDGYLKKVNGENIEVPGHWNEKVDDRYKNRQRMKSNARSIQLSTSKEYYDTFADKEYVMQQKASSLLRNL